ncbi:hypothetical protein EV128_12274 [Rhizobium azibense]|nr:hypothetical protein EV128_12274 [Rhizobium azibense]
MQTSAILSEDRKYRYRLDRWWSDRPRVAFVMLNPSIADETENDKTITRLIGFARDWNLGGFTVANLFAWRETYSGELHKVAEPIGANNDEFIMTVARSCCAVIVGWGAKGGSLNRDMHVMHLLRENGIQPLAFEVTKDGYPRHPLYLKRSAIPSPYFGRSAA